jgi:GntR family galactonate operon transcriptional repressor
MELGSRVVHGTYPAGTILPRADDLATELGVSRTVIREATRVLAEKGLVESRQRVGTRARERREWDLVDREVIAWQRAAGPDLEFFKNLSETRMAIEGTAARLAARRASPDEVQGMRKLCEQMERHADDATAYMRADLQLHAAILRAADNPLLLQLAHTVAEGLQASREVTVRSERGNLRAMPLHAAVVEAVAAGDEEAAASRMTRLLQLALDDIEAIMAAGPGSQAGGGASTSRRPGLEPAP